MANITDAQASSGASGASQELRDVMLRNDGHLRRMLYFRRQYDQRRAFFYRQYVGQQDRRTFPDNVTPRSNTFVNYPLSNVENITARVMDAFFSFNPWLEAQPRGERDELAADRMGKVLPYKLHASNFIHEFEELVRNLSIYGHAGIKVDWDWDYDIGVDPQPQFAQQMVPVGIGPDGQPQFAPQPIMDPQTGAPIVIGVNPVPKRVAHMRPRFTAIDVYDLLVDPDGGMSAHMAEKTLGQILREQELSTQEAQNDPLGVKQPLYYQDAVAQLQRNIAAVPGIEDPNEVIVRMAELWNEIDGTVSIQTFGKDTEAISWKDLRASFRQAQYSSWRRKVYGAEPILLYHGPNPFAHKRSPILHTSFIKLPNEVFGLGAIEIISDLVEALNRFTNMIADNWNLGINRRYAYDVNADIDHSALNLFNVPGGKVGVTGNPNEVIAPLPFFTPQRGDYAILDLYKGIIEMSSGVSDFYGKGLGSAQGNRTATGISNIIQESNFRFKLFIRNLELDILQPLLQMCASMIQQFMSDAEEVRITDQPTGIEKWIRVSPEELIGNFDFELVAANYATNKIVRQRNLLAFANWAAQTPYFNWGQGLREIGKVFEVRNIDKLVKSEQQVQMEQMQAQSSQMQMLLLEKILDTESKAIIAELSHPPPEGGAAANAHALRVQQFLEDFLAQSGVPVEGMPSQSGPRTKRGGGRPRGMQQEGKVPGAAETSPTREILQSLGAGGMGLSTIGNPNEA